MNPLMERFKHLKGELGWVLAGHGAAFLGGLLGIKVLTGLLGPAGYGELALGLTIAGFLTTFLHNPLSNAAARFFSPYRDTGRGIIYFAALRNLHNRLVSFLLPVILLVVISIFFIQGTDWGKLAGGGAAFGLAAGIGVILLAWQNASRDRLGAAITQASDVWLRIGLGILAAFFFGTGQATLAGYTVGTILVVAWQLVRAQKQYRAFELAGPEPSAAAIDLASREFRDFMLPFVGYAIFTAIALYADRWIIQISAGAAAVGIYAALFQIASSPVNLLFAVINQLMVPIIYERAGTMSEDTQRHEAQRLIRRTVMVALAFSLLGTALTALLAQPAAALLTSTAFARHASILWLLVLALSLWQTGQLMALEGICANLPSIYLWPKALHALVLLTTGYHLASTNGVTGMAQALFISSLIYLAAVQTVNWRLNNGLRSTG